MFEGNNGIGTGNELSDEDMTNFSVEVDGDQQDENQRDIQPGDPNYVEDPNAVELQFGDEGYVLKEGDPGYEAPADLKPGDEGYVPKLGDEGYVPVEGEEGYIAPEDRKPGDPGYELKPGDEGYVLKPGDEGYVAPTPPLDAEAIAAQARKDYLKSLGFDNEDDLKNKLKAPESPEEIATRQKEYDHAMNVFAVDKKLLSPEDFAEHTRVNTASDNDLVFAQFSAQYKEANKDRKNGDEAYPVTPDEITDAFESFYHTTSENPALKQQGQSAMEAQAKSIRDIPTGKVAHAKEVFARYQERQAQIPAYTTTIKAAISEGIPTELVLKEGDGDNKISFPLEGLVDKEAIEKELLTANNFDEYLEIEDKAQFVANLKEKILKDVYYNNRAKIQEEIYKVAHGVGLKKGSTTGAAVPFENKGSARVVTQNQVKYSDADREQLSELNP